MKELHLLLTSDAAGACSVREHPRRTAAPFLHPRSSPLLPWTRCDVDVAGTWAAKFAQFLVTSSSPRVATATNALFARMEFLSSECCAYQGAPCFRTLHDVCDPFPQTVSHTGRCVFPARSDVGPIASSCSPRTRQTTFSVEVSVPYSWISHRVEDFKVNLAKDISANLGVDAEGLTLGDFVEKDASTTSIDFTVRAQTEAAANLVRMRATSSSSPSPLPPVCLIGHVRPGVLSL